MKLYKYVSQERLDILLNNKIRFTQPLAWNDPFEMRPSYDNETVEDPFSQLLDLRNIFKHFQETGEVLEKEVQQFEKRRKRVTRDEIIRFINDNIVGLSLTEDKENLLMWAHYANQHQGFVIEFDTEHEFFKTNDRYLFKISYDDQRTRIEINDFTTLLMKFLQSLQRKDTLGNEHFQQISRLFNKSLSWEYEKEWRLISPIQNAVNYSSIENKKTFIKLGRDAAMRELYHNDCVALFNLPLSCVTSVYFGLRVPKKIPRQLYFLKNDNSKYSHINLYYAELNDNFFKLDFFELDDMNVLTLKEFQDIDVQQRIRNKSKNIKWPFRRS